MLDFKEITDGTQFEIFVREMLIAYGLRAFWSGVGPDGGKDLLCIEPQKSFFEDSEKKWLVSCKHNANSNNSVGINELGEITDLCEQHNATGYILICSTQPSAAVIARLEKISQKGKIKAIYWDATKIELMLSTPKLWRIAQKFMPISSESKKLNVIATEYPNQWVVTYDGFYFFLINRIGSDYNYYFNHIEKIIEDIKSIPLKNKDHFIRIRSIYFDDKHFSYDSYFKEGKERFRTEREEVEYRDGKENLRAINETNRVSAFNRLKTLFEKLDFLKVCRAVNCTIENLDKFYFQADWTKLLNEIEYEQGRFFSAWFFLSVYDDEKFHKFISCLPQSMEHLFRLTQVYTYVPNDENGSILSEEKDVKFYEFTAYIHPYKAKNKYVGRKLINDTFNTFSNAIENYIKINS